MSDSCCIYLHYSCACQPWATLIHSGNQTWQCAIRHLWMISALNHLPALHVWWQRGTPHFERNLATIRVEKLSFPRAPRAFRPRQVVRPQRVQRESAGAGSCCCCCCWWWWWWWPWQFSSLIDIVYMFLYVSIYIYIIHICKYCTLDLDSLIRFGYSLECSLEVQSRKIARVTVFLVQEILYGFYGHWWYLDVSQVYHAVSCSLGFQKLSWILLTPSNASLSKTSVLQIIR